MRNRLEETNEKKGMQENRVLARKIFLPEGRGKQMGNGTKRNKQSNGSSKEWNDGVTPGNAPLETPAGGG